MKLRDLIQKKDFVDDLSLSIRNIIFANFPHMTTAEKEDIDQEVKLKLWKMISDGKNIINLRSYLWRMVYTTTLDVLHSRMPSENLKERRLEERSVFSLFALHDADPLDPDTPESILQINEEKASVHEAINVLPIKRRIVVKMHFQGMSIEETALFLGWSQNKVRHLLYRGLGDLKKEVKNCGGMRAGRAVGFKKEPA